MKLFKDITLRLMEKSSFVKWAVNLILPSYLRLKQKKQNKIFLQNGADLLKYFKKCLDEKNLKFWLTSGTLLGAYREHRLLGHDIDLDVAMFAEDQKDVADALISGGFKLEHEFGVVGENIKEQSFSYKDVKIDIFYIEKHDNKFMSHVFFKHEINKKNDDFHVIQMFFPETDFIEYDFLGAKYLIPQKTKEYLAANYGEDFMTPNKNWDYRKDIPSAKYFDLEEKRGYCILY